MKVLLDHNMKPKLRLMLPGHQVSTARQMKWDELDNGDLLTAAEREGFTVMVTGDQSISYQQNNPFRRIALVVLSDTNWAAMRLAVDLLGEAISRSAPGSFEFVNIPRRPQPARKIAE